MTALIADTLGTSYHAARLPGIAATAALFIPLSFLIPLLSGRDSITPTKSKRDETHLPPSADYQNQPTESADKRPTLKSRLFNVFLGADHRLSTSTTIAWCWTAVILYIFLSLIIAWPDDWSLVLKDFFPTYFVLLGGPYAAFVIARIAVTARVSNQTLQKPGGDGIPKLSDLVSNDQGNTDLFDLQYVAFNFTAIAFVLVAFVHNSGGGFPNVPQSLWLLTGGPAAIYSANKAFGTNEALIFSVTPTVAKIGDQFTVAGQNFLPAPATDVTGPGNTATTADFPQVLLGGVNAPTVSGLASGTSITARVPENLAALPIRTPLDVTVVTTAKQTTTLRGQFTVVRAPTLLGIDRDWANVGDTVTLSGSWADPAGTAPLHVLIGNLAVSPAPGATTQHADIVIPQLTIPDGNTISATVSLIQFDQPSETKTLTVKNRPT